jgi:PAS domain S-box-containing protein
MADTGIFKGDLQQVIDQLPVVVFEYTFFPSGDRGFTYISPRCEELIGLHPDTVMKGHLSIDNYIHPEDLHGFHHSVSQSVRDISDWRWRGRCTGPRGYLWIEAKGSPSLNEDGRIIYHGVFSDITATKELEDRQQMSESRYRNLVDKLPLGIVVLSDGVIRFANASATRLLGAQDPVELLGREALQLVHPDFRSLASERIAAVLRGQQVAPIETRYIRLDGKEVIVNSMASPYEFEGKPAIQVIFADITDRKVAEADYQRAQTLFFELFRHTPLAIVLLNERSEVVQVNKGFELLFDYSLDELKGKILTEAIVPPELEQEGNEINSLITENNVIRVETVRRRKDGQSVSVIIYGVPVVLGEKKIGIFGMYVDITERQHIEEELKIRNAELDNFVYKVSHDLRAPLSSVLGLAQLAVMPGNRDDLVDYIRLIGEKARQLDHFISDVLSHSKNLKMEVAVERVNIHEIISKAFSELSYLAGAQEINKTITVSGSDLFSDQWRLGEIFRNLISNAIKYRKLEYPQAEVLVQVHVTESACEILVKDNGIGIEENLLPRVFEMFFRATDRSDGSGLGLYIVKNAVDRLGGTMDVRSDAGKGTRFSIVIPNLMSK